MDIFSDTPCILGEGPMWHPTRKALFWFDIKGKKMFCKAPGGPQQQWDFDRTVSAAGWVDHDTLLVATQTDLIRFDIPTGTHSHVIDVEADNPVTRANDSRADPQGGFWVGTMGLNAEMEAGAIYRYYKGELRQLYDRISVANAICFAPDGQSAYFTDTRKRKIMRVALDAEGWPAGEAQVFADLYDEGLKPDGAVVDAAGNLWNAQWGVGRVAVYTPDGRFDRAYDVPAAQTTCPAFGGGRLYVTSGCDGIEAEGAGMTYVMETDIQGQDEHKVIL